MYLLSRLPETSACHYMGRIICSVASSSSAKSASSAYSHSKYYNEVLEQVISEISFYEEDIDVDISAPELSEHDQRTQLHNDLSNFVVEQNLSRDGTNSLLKLLKKCITESESVRILPDDYRSLLKLPRSAKDADITADSSGGSYIFLDLSQVFGDQIEFNLRKKPHLFEALNVSIDLSIDGIPLFKSSKLSFWPILGQIGLTDPFLIGIWYGEGKPKGPDYFLAFLKKFDESREVNVLGVTYSLYPRLICADAPARVLLKNTAGHTAANACDRCTAVAKTLSRRQIYYDYGTPRTTEGFRSLQYTTARENAVPHQKGRSVFSDFVDCVSQIPLEIMHCVYEGVGKRIVKFLMEESISRVKLSSNQIKTLNRLLRSLKLPPEFSRTPSSLVWWHHWKATELRSFLLYTGPVILKIVLSKSAYEHFVKLSLYIRMLCCNEFRSPTWIEMMRTALTRWVTESRAIYGNAFCVYNVHLLPHLVDDYSKFGNLQAISAFQYENQLRMLKKLIRNNVNPLASVHKKSSLYLKPRLKTIIIPKISPMTAKIGVRRRNHDCWVLLHVEKLGICVGEVTKSPQPEEFIARVVSVKSLDPLLKSEETLCRKLHLYVMSTSKGFKDEALFIKSQVLRKFVCLEMDRKRYLLAMSKDLFSK